MKSKRPNQAGEGREQGIGDLFKGALRMWGTSNPRRFIFFLRVAYRLWLAQRRRLRNERSISGRIPWVLAISPTMRCNYNCKGCYSRGRRTDEELTGAELDALFTEAEELGILAVVVTGGEPLLRSDLLELIARHRGLLFVLITNGSLLTVQSARHIAGSGNVVVLVSIEGPPGDTDERRQAGAHRAAMRAFKLLQDAQACFGFAAMVTTANSDHVMTDEFVDEMVDLGCSLGYFTEYVPCGRNVKLDWCLNQEGRAAVRQRVLDLRRRKPIVLIQFPGDEYGEDNLCSAAGRASLHINAQGDVEPCPFVPISADNIRRGGLTAACRSRFVRSIRERPDLLRQEKYACALFEHYCEVKALGRQFGARARD